MTLLGRRAGLVAACAALVAVLAGCGGKTKTNNPTQIPTVSMWVDATAADYRQVAAGAKLALSDRQGRSGVFRINYAGRLVSDDPTRATADALNNARDALQDVQVSGVVVGLQDVQARQAITLLNEAGIPTAAVGDAALKADACTSKANIFPSGHQTAIVVADQAKPSPEWTAKFQRALGFAPDGKAFGAYQAASALLSSVGAPGVVQVGSDPKRLNRDAMAAQLVRDHSGC